MHAPRLPRLVVLFFILVLALGTACSDDDPAEPQVSADCAGLSNVECAAAKVSTANQLLESILYTNLNSDPERPSDVNVQAPLTLYKQALTLDPSNMDAHFGAAVLGLLGLSSDAEVNAAFDEWKAYLEDHVPFEAPNAAEKPTLGVPLTFRAGREALGLPFDLIARSVVAQARGSMTVASPQISRVQAILRDRVLPRLTEARAHLGIVADNPGYRYIVTPRMQGDDDASAAEIDRTDILALRAACGLLAAVCDVAVSYELSFSAYDSLGLVQALTPGSDWMSLRNDGAAHMADARLSLLGAVDDVEDAIASLRAEQDDQDDDVIKTDPYDFQSSDLDSIQAHLPDVRNGLDGGYTRVDDWDLNSSTPPVSLTIRAGALFTDPVDDWKALFPPYTVTARRVETSQNYEYNTGTTTKTVTTGSGTYYAYFQLSAYNGQVSTYYSGDDTLRAAAEAVIQEQFTIIQSLPSWTGSYYGYSYFYGYVDAGTHDIAFSWYEDYQTTGNSVFVPVITWDAETFDQWDLPDPTLHGLLPDLGTSEEFFDTFGITASDWEREVVLDWTDLGFNLAAPRPRVDLQRSRTAMAPRRTR